MKDQMTVQRINEVLNQINSEKYLRCIYLFANELKEADHKKRGRDQKNE